MERIEALGSPADATVEHRITARLHPQPGTGDPLLAGADPAALQRAARPLHGAESVAAVLEHGLTALERQQAAGGEPVGEELPVAWRLWPELAAPLPRGLPADWQAYLDGQP